MFPRRFPFRSRGAQLALALPLAGILGAQTQVDLRTQSKSVDFQGASMTRPMRTSATLPATCVVNELLLLTTAAAGSNIYVCLTANNWVPQGGAGGAVSIQNGGTAVGSRSTENFTPGAGILNAITDTGTRLNIQQTVDTALVLSKAALQAGGPLLCQSASGSATTYSCALSPTLTAYTSGMVLHWRPDVTGAGGSTTLNVDILGATPLIKADGVSNPGATDILAGQMYTIWYDGTAFRLLTGASGSSSSGGVSGPPAIVTGVGAGGSTVLTGTSEWHSALAVCSGASTATVVWNQPPGSAAAATADGCSGSNVNDGYAAFASTGTPSVQASFMLPRTLTGRADVYITYLTPTSAGTFTMALDAVCTPPDSSALNDPVIVGGNFYVSGTVTGPATASQLATLSGTSLSWPSGCAAGNRVHLRLMRTDTTGTASKVDVAEVVIVLRRTL